MNDLNICRICLRTEATVYNLQLKSYYEEIVAVKDEKYDLLLPRYFCYECAFLLQKFHKFREKCYTGYQALRGAIWMGQVTNESVSKIDRTSKNLISPLETTKVLVVSCDINDEPSIGQQIKIEYDIENINYPDDDPVEVDPVGDCDIKREDCNEEADIVKSEKVQDHLIERKLPVRVKKSVVKKSGPKRTADVKKTEQKRKTEKVIILKKKPKCTMRMKKRQKKFPDLTNWKVHVLSQEDAMKQFKERAENSKYIKAPHKCTDCFKGFSNEDIYNRHRILRHDESVGNKICDYCKMRFHLNCNLTKHLTQHTHRYECLRCHLICAIEGSAFQHDQYHNGKISKCKICGEEFKYSSTYYSHLRTAHRSEFLCPDCGESFVSQTGLRMHKKYKHMKKNTNESPKKEGDSEDLYCDTCDIKFNNSAAYDHHFLRSVKHNEDEESRAMKRRSLDINGGRVSRRRKPTTCIQCGKHFKCYLDCMNHHKKEHPRTAFYAQRYICEICGASLAMGSIAAHLNNHTRERMHSCHTCGRQFSTSVSLKRHLLTHTGEKPFACSLCDKRFTQSNSMKLHYRTFHLKEPYPKRNRRKKDPSYTNPQTESCSNDAEWKDSNSAPTTVSSIEPAPSQQRFYFI